MKLKSYSHMRAFFCYFNPVIGAMCSCCFLNPILFWKGQSASLDALSGYRAPKRGNFQLRSKSNHVGKMSHGETRGFEAGDPVWKGWSQSERMESTRQGHLGEAAEACRGQEARWPWRGHADMGRWIQRLLRARCCAMPMWPSPSQLMGFFPFSACGSTACRPKITWGPGKHDICLLLLR